MFEANDKGPVTQYKLTSTVILHLSTGAAAADSAGEMDLSGNMTRQVQQQLPVQDDSSHIVNIGKVSICTFLGYRLVGRIQRNSATTLLPA